MALCVALVNNGSGITALYVLLVCVGWILFLVYAIRPGFMWLLRRTGSIQNGPTQAMVALTLLLVLTSSWFTGIIGVHPIFGGMFRSLHHCFILTTKLSFPCWTYLPTRWWLCHQTHRKARRFRFRSIPSSLFRTFWIEH